MNALGGFIAGLSKEMPTRNGMRKSFLDCPALLADG
jgi:hypothetical protein